MKIPKKWRWKLETVCLQLLIAILQVLSIKQCVRFCRFMAWLLADVIKFRRKIIHDNIIAVYPDYTPQRVSEMTTNMWYHLLMMGCELAHAPRKIHDSNWRKYVYIRDKVLMTKYLIDYRPLVAVSGHYGNFEMAGYVTGLLGMPSYTIARKLDNDYLNNYVNRFREWNGQFLLPKNGSAPMVQKILASGAILTLLGDQHAGNKGCWVDFLGRPASCHKAVALFTLNGRAPMMVSYCRHTDEPLHFEIGSPGVADPMTMPEELNDVKALTQWYNDRMAEVVREDPNQFWWVHRRWKEKPVRRAKKQKAAAA